MSHARKPPPTDKWLLLVAYFGASFIGGVGFVQRHMPEEVGFGARPAWLLMGGVAGVVVAIFLMLLYFILDDLL